MSIIDFILVFFHLYVVGFCIYPAVLTVLLLFKSKRHVLKDEMVEEADYAVIVTAYEQVQLIPDVVNSILECSYSNFCIYVVADNCDISSLVFEDPRVYVLRPEMVLANNIRSHFHAIQNFKRNHDRITIIDSDNIVDPEYFRELNRYFDAGFDAVQGVRKAKNLNSELACLDEAGDIYYRYIDRFLLFKVGSSASLAGSGMAFSTQLYVTALGGQVISGAGFDKLLQYQLVDSETRIAFAKNAVVYDTKTSKSKQLVEQRARWINTWFKYASWGAKMMASSVFYRSWNKFIFSIMLLRPPLFLLFLFAFMIAIVDVIYYPEFLLLLVFAGILFLFVFFRSLFFFTADKSIYRALISIPKFVLLQIFALVNAKRANKLSVATRHDRTNAI